MIETVTALLALLLQVQAAMTDPDHAWPQGYSWALPIKYTLTDAQLLANQPACCYYVTVPGSGVILRADIGTVYLRKGAPQ